MMRKLSAALGKTSVADQTSKSPQDTTLNGPSLPQTAPSGVTQDVYLLPLTDDGAPDVPGGYVSLPPPQILPM